MIEFFYIFILLTKGCYGSEIYFLRASFSSTNEWPYASPFAGYYDVTNSTTGLILLNQRFKYVRHRLTFHRRHRKPNRQNLF